jgi:hypothetical protein
VCGDGKCDPDESMTKCPGDCAAAQCHPAPVDPILYGVNGRTGEQDHTLRHDTDIVHVEIDTRGRVGQTPFARKVSVDYGFIVRIPGTQESYCLTDDGVSGWAVVRANDGTQNFVKAAGRDDLRMTLSGPNGSPVLFSHVRGIKVSYSPYTTEGVGGVAWRRSTARGFRPNGDENAAYNDACAWDPANPGDPRGLVSHVTSESALTNVSHGAGILSYTFAGATTRSVTISQNALDGAASANGLRVVTAVQGGVTYVSYRDVVANNGRAYTFDTDGSAAAMWPDSPAGLGTYLGSYGNPFVTWTPGIPETVMEVTPDEKSVLVAASAGSVSVSRNAIALDTTTFDAFGRYTGSSEQGGEVDVVLGYDGLWRPTGVASAVGQVSSLDTVAFDPQSGLPSLITHKTSLEPLSATKRTYTGGSNGVLATEETLLGGALVNGALVGARVEERVVPSFVANPATGFPVLAGWNDTAFDTLLGQVTTSFAVAVTPTQRRVSSLNNPAYVEIENFDELGRPMNEQASSPIGSAVASVLEWGPGGYPSKVQESSNLFGGPTLVSGATLGILPNGYQASSYDPVCASKEIATTSNGVDSAAASETTCLGITSKVNSASLNLQNSVSESTTTGPGLAESMREVCSLSAAGVLQCNETGTDDEGDPEVNSYSESGH